MIQSIRKLGSNEKFWAVFRSQVVNGERDCCQNRGVDHQNVIWNLVSHKRIATNNREMEKMDSAALLKGDGWEENKRSIRRSELQQLQNSSSFNVL